jgi:hypothetical protein
VPDHPESSDTVLAGCFPDDSAEVVAELVNEAGGEIVADVDETWTRPRSNEGRAWDSGFGKERMHA